MKEEEKFGWFRGKKILLSVVDLMSDEDKEEVEVDTKYGRVRPYRFVSDGSDIVFHDS